MHSTLKNTSIYLLLILISIFLIRCKQGSIEKEAKVVPEIISDINIEEQLHQIMSWWPGTFNNDEQIDEAIRLGKDVWRLDDSGENGYLHLQSHYIKLDKPEIAEHVLYVEEYRDHDPDATYRQRIYTLGIDSTEQIKVKMWPFKDKKKYVGAWKDISILNDLKIEEISAFPDICDLYVSRDNDAYLMVMNGSDCAFGEKVFNYGVKLTKDKFSYRDKITQKNDGTIISTAANFAYHDLNRIN